MNKSFYSLITKVQSELKAPKGQFNKFGGYKYRNCEDILEAVKPLLSKLGLVITINDELINMGNRFYIKATATISDGENSISNSALAREAETKKGMDESQITGAASSYARKYALNGLLLIDDTKDADATETHGKEETKEVNETKSFSSKAKELSDKKLDETVKTITEPKKSSGGWAAARKKTTETTPSKGDLY